MRRPARRGRGQTDQDLVELAGDVALQAVDDLPAARPLVGASGHVAAGPVVESWPGQHDGVASAQGRVLSMCLRSRCARAVLAEPMAPLSDELVDAPVVDAV